MKQEEAAVKGFNG